MEGTLAVARPRLGAFVAAAGVEREVVATMRLGTRLETRRVAIVEVVTVEVGEKVVCTSTGGRRNIEKYRLHSPSHSPSPQIAYHLGRARRQKTQRTTEVRRLEF